MLGLNKIALTLCLAFVLIGCSGNNNTPDVDTNANGVRDDVDNYIAKQNLTDDQKYGLSLVARSYQQIIVSGGVESNGSEKSIDKTLGSATSCSDSKFDNLLEAFDWQEKVLEVTNDTKARKHAYKQFYARLFGTVFTLPKGEQCRFFE